MNLIRSKDQPSATIEEFYSRISNPPELGPAMLSLIERLRAVPEPVEVYGLTSHERLCLLPADSSAASWPVIFIALDFRNYFVEYLVPEKLAPWPNAYMRGEAQSENQAVEMILTAMRNSGAWSISAAAAPNRFSSSNNPGPNPEVPRVMNLPADADVVAIADFLLTHLLQNAPASLIAEPPPSGPFGFSLKPDGSEPIEVYRCADAGEFRAILARFGHHYLDGQLYGGFSQRILEQGNRRCVTLLYLSNNHSSGLWLRFHTHPALPVP